ncbi:MAG TPA: ABC transporter permease [Chloroflexota bacterium]|nr:ABC transporter permease [Chloroflexota bacterium]
MALIDRSTELDGSATDTLFPSENVGRFVALRDAFQRLLRTRLAGFGLVVLGLLVLLAIFASVLAPYDPQDQALESVLQAPSSVHLFGTDDLGRDILSRVIYGSRVSLEVGLISVSVALVGGCFIGLVAGYFGGLVDEALMRAMDALAAFPALILALAITSALGMGIGNAMIAIGIVYIPAFARLVRGQSLSVRERDFVTAARSLGAGHFRIMFCHIWPNVTAPIIVQASLSVGFAIITEAALSFLGVGVRPPTPSWGSMLNEGYQYLETAPWMSVAPGAAIFITVLGLNLLGDGLRAMLDPRLSRR